MSLLVLPLLAAAALQADRDWSEVSSKEARQMVHDYGACVVRKQQRRASEAMLAEISNGQLMRRYPQLIDGKCMKVPIGQTAQMRFKGQQFRYALADALVQTELAASPVPSFGAVPRLSHVAPIPPSRVSDKGKPLKEARYQELLREYHEDQAFALLSRYGECVVRVEPAASKALLLTDPASAAEATAFTALRTAFGTCLAEGETLSFGKVALRGTVASNYYRLAKASAGASK